MPLTLYASNVEKKTEGRAQASTMPGCLQSRRIQAVVPQRVPRLFFRGPSADQHVSLPVHHVSGLLGTNQHESLPTLHECQIMAKDPSPIKPHPQPHPRSLETMAGLSKPYQSLETVQKNPWPPGLRFTVLLLYAFLTGALSLSSQALLPVDCATTRMQHSSRNDKTSINHEMTKQAQTHVGIAGVMSATCVIPRAVRLPTLAGVAIAVMSPMVETVRIVR